MPQPITILLLASDPEVQQVLHRFLPAHGFRLQEAFSSEPDLILVDLAPPDGDGIEVIRQIRAETHTPIIVLCRRDDERTTVAALDCGADDYVTKPFSTHRLTAHLRAVL